MPQIGIITGVKTEQQALEPILGAENAPIIRLSGARPTRARQSIKSLIETGVDGILSFGSAGALKTDLLPGTLILGEKVLGPDGITHACDPIWVKSMSDILGIQPVSVAGSEHLMGTDAKARLFKDTSCAAVDMESHIAAELAQQAGIPFGILRAIVDPVEFEFPEFVLDSVRPDGSVSLLPIIAGLCIQPWLTGRLIDLNKYNNAAMGALSSATGTLGPRCGLSLLAL